MWPTQLDGLLQFAAALLSLVASWVLGRVQDAHTAATRARKQAATLNGHLRVRSPHNAPTPRHKRTAAIHAPATRGERAADAVASAVGSWRFILIQTALVILWMLGNAWLLTHPFDPYPFILLNLAFSTQAAYAAPILQMASNRQAAKDRIRDDAEAREVDVMSKQLLLLERINRQQLEILTALHEGPRRPPQPSSQS